MNKKILVLDFDGVIHSYSSGWKGIDVIPDLPVDGAIGFIVRAVEHFDVQIFSSRSSEYKGRDAMKNYLVTHLYNYFDGEMLSVNDVMSKIWFPVEKPPAFVSIDDRAIQFEGVFPSIEDLKMFKPWYQREGVFAI
jgi:hypothetical protein